MADVHITYKPQSLWPKSPQIVYQEWHETQDERKYTKHVAVRRQEGCITHLDLEEVGI